MNSFDDRRQPSPRREHDTVLEVERDYDTWIRKIVVHRGLGLFVVSVLTYLVTTLGFRFVGTPHDVAELGKVVARHDTAIARTVSDIRDLKNEVHFQNYLQCVSLRRTDPAAVPPECNTIISIGSRP